VERIELVKGTGATLYGSDAIGGVLNIITRQPGDGLRIGVRQEFTVLGNGGNRTFLPSVQFESAHEDWGIVADAGYRHADGFDLQPETPHTNGQEEISRFSGGLKLIYDPESKWRYGTSGRVMWEEKDWRESEYFEPLQQTFAYDDRERNVRADVGVQASWNPDQHTGYTVGGHISYYDHWWKKWSETGHLVDSSVTVEHYQEVSFSGRRRLSRAHLPAYGLDFTNNVFESDMLSPDREGVQTFDGYYQHEWRVTHGVTALPGVRYEHHSAYGDHVNPSLNAMWRPCSHFRLRGMVARGFRAPSIKELYFRFDHSAAGYIVEGGGAGLDPETSINSSLTMEFTKGERYLSRITYFYNHLRDLIDFDLVGFSEVYWRGMFKYRNVRKAYTCGVEYEMDYRPNENLRLELGYTYLRARDLGTGETLLNRPENKVQLKLSGRVERWDAGGSFWGSWTDRKLWSPITEAGGTGPGSWAPDKLNLNINLYKNLNPSVRAFFNIYNVTDEVNADYGYWPGRTFGVGFTYEFGQD
jgi:outer membrane receptor for ferrienterochelin and colicins